MATLHIKNIGALRDTGEIELRRINLVLGPQGAGKSTLMKILCFCRWLEKEYMTKDDGLKKYKVYGRFLKELKQFHRFDDSFFSEDSYIKYQSEILTITYAGKKNPVFSPSKQVKSLRHNTKIAFLPAERNLVSAVASIDKNYRSSTRDVLFNFILELEEAKALITSEKKKALSIDESLSYYNVGGVDYIWLEKEARALKSFYVSSGIQSSFPIDVMASYLYEQLGQTSSLSASELTARIMGLLSTGSSEVSLDLEKVISLRKLLHYMSFQLYIEEPEQNLYPESQRKLILSLLSLMNMAQAKEQIPQAQSLLFITTHSPYMLSVLNTQMAIARTVKNLEESAEQERLERIKDYLSQKGFSHYLSIEDYAAYFLGKDGVLRSIIDPEFPMISGNELDGVSDWANDFENDLYQIAYGNI